MSDIPTPSRHQGPFAKVFLAHPATVNESYLQHMRFALGFAGWLALAAGAALVHAVIPALCESTASRIVRKLADRLERRHEVERP